MDFHDYFADGVLAAALQKTVNEKRVARAHVALMHGDACIQADAGMLESKAPGQRVRAGCIAKSLTAMLIARAVSEGRLTFEQSLAELLPISSDALYAPLQTIRISHLLNHTHGLDDSAILEVPRQANGYIDKADLLRRLLMAPRLASAGALYSYGSGGSWLAAAILESIYGMPYAALLDTQLLQPLGIEAIESSDVVHRDICPASGNALRLSAPELIRIIAQHCNATPSIAAAAIANPEHLQQLVINQFAVAGWQARFSRVGLGWNEYGAGWFGHSAKFAGESAVVRFCPSHDLGIAITGVPEECAFAILAALFSKMLPEFTAAGSSPKPLSAAEWEQLNPSRYVGTYENASWSLVVDLARNRQLRVRAYLKEGLDPEFPEPYAKRYLKPANSDIFFTDPPEPILLPYMQFLTADDAGSCSYIQNGRQVFIRRA